MSKEVGKMVRSRDVVQAEGSARTEPRGPSCRENQPSQRGSENWRPEIVKSAASDLRLL